MHSVTKTDILKISLQCIHATKETKEAVNRLVKRREQKLYASVKKGSRSQMKMQRNAKKVNHYCFAISIIMK